MIDPSKKCEKSLKVLSELCGIFKDYGWKKDLAEKLQVPKSDIYNWIIRDEVPEDRLVEISEKSFAKEKWYLVDSSVKAAGIDKVSSPREQSNQRFHDALDKIFQSKEFAIIEAVKANIQVFAENLKTSKKLKKLEKEVEVLKKEGRGGEREVKDSSATTILPKSTAKDVL